MRAELACIVSMSSAKRRRVVLADDESDDEADSQLPFQEAPNQNDSEDDFDNEDSDMDEHVDEIGGDGRRKAGEFRFFSGGARL